MTDIEKADDIDKAGLYLLEKEEALQRVREMLPKEWSANLDDHGYICVSDGRINGEVSLDQVYDDRRIAGYAADTLAENTRKAIAEIQATPRIENVSPDDCLLAVAEYGIVRARLGRERGMADGLLMNRVLCSVDVANEALEFYMRHDLWECGSSARAGWLTKAGFSRLREIAPEFAAYYKFAQSHHADMIDPDDEVAPKEAPPNFGDGHAIERQKSEDTLLP